MQPDLRETTASSPVSTTSASQSPANAEPVGAHSTANNPKTPQTKRKKLIVVASAVGVLLLGGAAFAYTAWNNNPDKVLADAFQNSFSRPLTSAKGTLKFDSDGTNVAVNFALIGNKDSEANVDADLTVESGAAAIKAGVSVVTAKNGDIFLKVKDAKKLLSTFTGGSAEAEALYADLVTKLDNKWIKITQTELNELTGSAEDKQITCARDAFRSLQSDKKQQSEIRKVFETNRFVTVAETFKSGKIGAYDSHHYKLGFDEGKSKAFGATFVSTEFYKKLNACTDGQLSEDTSDDGSTSGDVPTVEVWVDKGSHQLTKLRVAGKDGSETSGSLEMTTEFNKPQNVTVPKGDTTLTELQTEFQKALQSYYGGPGTDDASLMAQ